MTDSEQIIPPFDLLKKQVEELQKQLIQANMARLEAEIAACSAIKATMEERGPRLMRELLALQPMKKGPLGMETVARAPTGDKEPQDGKSGN